MALHKFVLSYIFIFESTVDKTMLLIQKTMHQLSIPWSYQITKFSFQQSIKFLSGRYKKFCKLKCLHVVYHILPKPFPGLRIRFLRPHVIDPFTSAFHSLRISQINTHFARLLSMAECERVFYWCFIFGFLRYLNYFDKCGHYIINKTHCI